MQLSNAGLEFIKGFEKLRLAPYNDSDNPPNCTVGYGHLVHPGPVTPADQSITEPQAIDYLKQDVAYAEHTVSHLVKVPLSQNQYDALVSFVFNVGGRSFETSTLLKALNAGGAEQVPAQLLRWDKTGGVASTGLLRRRKAEAAMWQQSQRMAT